MRTELNDGIFYFKMTQLMCSSHSCNKIGNTSITETLCIPPEEPKI